MVQLVTRVDDATAQAVDRLVAEGVVDSRSDAVRRGLALLVDTHDRAKIAAAILRGYTLIPQTDEEALWANDAAASMIAEEPW
ncbi:MAG: hypothetical protein WD651_15525 [Acidimicrobiia bacterium]